MNITLDPNTLWAIGFVCTTVLSVALWRTLYQVHRMRHTARTAAQWDRLQRDVIQDAVNRKLPVQVSPEGVSINAK